MKIVRIFLLLTLAIPMSVSCRKTDPESADDSGMIYFQVTPEAAVSKSMISGYDNLKTACSPDGGGKSIGLWAAMKKGGETTNDVFQGVNLQWLAVGEKGHENNPDSNETGPGRESYWNTFITENNEVKHAEVYWHPGETYYFRAYYPAGVELANNTSAYTFIAEYNCEQQQDDLMAAYQKVELLDKPSLQQHVKLSLLHMLSAVEFRFRFKEEAGFEKDDKLTSMWLENTAGGQFGNYGLLVFGDGKQETDPGANPTSVEWYIIDTPAPGTRMYYWKHNGGIRFYRDGTVNVPATAYSDPVNTTEGNLFTGSSWKDSSDNVHNYIFIIPQDLAPGTQICFTTENSGNQAFRVNLPDKFYDNASNEYTSLEPGYRYTFNIVISKLDIDVFITIKEWNKLDSSYSIDF